MHATPVMPIHVQTQELNNSTYIINWNMYLYVVHQEEKKKQYIIM